MYLIVPTVVCEDELFGIRKGLHRLDESPPVLTELVPLALVNNVANLEVVGGNAHKELDALRTVGNEHHPSLVLVFLRPRLGSLVIGGNKGLHLVNGLGRDVLVAARGEVHLQQLVHLAGRGDYIYPRVALEFWTDVVGILEVEADANPLEEVTVPRVGGGCGELAGSLKGAAELTDGLLWYFRQHRIPARDDRLLKVIDLDIMYFQHISED